jgi:acetyl esterase/lipase
VSLSPYPTVSKISFPQTLKTHSRWNGPPLAVIPNIDRQLADLEQALNAASDQRSITSTTARFILEFVKEAKENPKSFDAKPSSTPPRPPDAGAAPVQPSRKHGDSIASRGATMDFGIELRRAAGMAADVKAGRDPMAGVKGDVLLAYRSDLDGMLMPYRVYVPSAYERTRKFPLVILLHGANSDENTLMNSGVVQRAAERSGYIVAAVNGRGPFGGYRKDNGAEKDVFDVLALMQKYYNIDENRIFLSGHSMGGMGTWRIGLEFRDRFAAIAPSAGTRDTAEQDAQLASGRKIPILLSCGGQDTIVPCAAHVAVYRKLKAAGYPTKIVEYPEDTHWTVFTSAVPEMFAWFDNFSAH